jgi:hypothetical protein
MTFILFWETIRHNDVWGFTWVDIKNHLGMPWLEGIMENLVSQNLITKPNNIFLQ